MKFKELFTQGSIGSLSVKNRIVMPAMGTVQAGPDGEMTEHLIAYYSERAAGGTGLIITEIVCIEYELGKATICQLRLDDDQFIPGFSRLAASVQKYGAKIFVQLHHAGNQSNSILTRGMQIVAPSPVTSKAVNEQPRELSITEVKKLIERFVSAAKRAQIAGIDGVELHGAHGYLIGQFLSSHTNIRKDEYGGSFENRMRFITEIIDGIKHECGKEFPICVRFDADEFTGYGIDLNEGVKIAHALEKAGTDILHVSSGTYESMPTVIEPVMYPEGWRVYLAEAVKKEVSIPVIAVGAIKRPQTAEVILNEKRADFVAIGRGLLSDPLWVKKAAEEKENEIITCIGCMHCVDRIFSFQPIRCAVNARAGRELEFPSEKLNDGKNRVVAVIGAGPSGMEAARVLNERGFKPIVYEQKNESGGELIPGCRPPGKKPIQWYKDALFQNLKQSGIEFKFGVKAEPDTLDINGEPYAVIIAIGAKPLKPTNISGLNHENVFTAIDVLNYPEMINSGSKVVIIGGGITGCETAEMLAEKGVDVTIIEMMSDLAAAENSILRTSMMQHIQENQRIKVLTNHRVLAVKSNEIEIQNTRSGQKKEIHADYFVLSFGMEPLAAEATRWRERYKKSYVVGDALFPEKVAFAVRTAFETAYTLL